MKILKKISSMIGICAAVMALGSTPIHAGQWEESFDGSWKYEENGVYLTGWQQVDGIWYYMDPETELWVARPEINEESVCYLLENAVNKAGWYRNEESLMYYQIDSSSKYGYTVSLVVSEKPYFMTGTLNTFDISKKTGLAKSQSTKEVLELYN